MEYKINQIVIHNLSFKNGSYKGGPAFSTSKDGWVKATAKLEYLNTHNVTAYK